MFTSWHLSLGPGVPKSLIVDSVSDNTVALSWMTPIPTNGIITQYELQYRSFLGGSYTTLEPLNNAVIRTVTGLTFDTEYCFRVRAYTVVGSGSYNAVTRGKN